jgi:hypothetical protein
VARFVILIVLVGLIAEAIISLIEYPSDLAFTLSPGSWKLTAPLWAALATAFVVGGLFVLTAVVIAGQAPGMIGWIVLIAAWLGAMLGIAAVRGDTELLRATLR